MAGTLIMIIGFIWLSAASAQQEWDIRLEDGPSTAEGRVEVFLAGSWGTVCDKKFGLKGWPAVACRDLGYSSIISATYASDENAPAPGGTPVNLMNLGCPAAKTSTLSECKKNAGCGHEKDVYVKCEGGAGNDKELTETMCGKVYEGIGYPTKVKLEQMSAASIAHRATQDHSGQLRTSCGIPAVQQTAAPLCEWSCVCLY